jgi:hypothetical protein
MISWSSKKQKHTADSSCYAEYIMLHHAGKELVFLRELLHGLGHPLPPAHLSTATMMPRNFLPRTTPTM